MVWPLLVASDKSHFKIAWAAEDPSWLLKTEKDLAQRYTALDFAMGAVISLSLSQLGFDSFCTLARQLPGRDSSRGIHTHSSHSSRPVFIFPLLLSLKACSLLDNCSDQRLLLSRKTLSRELVDMSQYGSQGPVLLLQLHRSLRRLICLCSTRQLASILLAMTGLFKGLKWWLLPSSGWEELQPRHWKHILLSWPELLSLCHHSSCLPLAWHLRPLKL